MASRLISRLKALGWVAIGLGILVSAYLLPSAAETKVVADRKGELALIAGTTNLAELKAHASGLVMVADNAGHISIVLIWVAVTTLLVLAVLAGVSIRWLGRLQRDINEKSPDA
jgi:hypothetical protein